MAEQARALAAVTSLLANTLSKSGVIVTPGRPNRLTEGAFLYLYGIHVDEHLRNIPLDEGQVPPLWVVLKYFLFVSDPGTQGSLDSLEKFGKILRAVHSNEHLQYSPALPLVGYEGVLEPLYQEFKLTIEELSIDTISRILSSSESFYSCGVGLQLRPVPLLPDSLPRYSQLVGVDYTTSPAKVRPPEEGDGRQLNISLAPSPALLMGTEPLLIEAESEIILRGEQLAQETREKSFLEIQGVDFPLLSLSDKEARVFISTSRLKEGKLSAGIHQARLKYVSGEKHPRYSVAAPLRLIPAVTEIDRQLLERVFESHLILHISGSLLGARSGASADQVSVALMREGRIIAASTKIEFVSEEEENLPYQSKIAAHFEDQEIEEGKVLVLVRVNGQQAIKTQNYEVRTL